MNDTPDRGLGWGDYVAAWHARATQLALWALERIFVRTDRYGAYYLKDGGKRTCTKPKDSTEGAVNQNLLKKHFAASTVSDVIGAHPLTLGKSLGRWIAIDIDAHDPTDDPDRNKRYAEHLVKK
jgi:hypothetical protein